MFLLFFKMKNSFQRKKKTTRRTHKNGRSDADPREEGELKKKIIIVLYIFEILNEFILFIFLSVFVRV